MAMEIGVGLRAWGLGIGLRTLLISAFCLGPIPRPSAPSPIREAQYWCPMHPDERSEVRGKCAICGMALVPMPPARFATYPVDLRVTPTLTGARLRLAVVHPSSKAIVRKFSIVHERPMHLFVVGDGLEYFAHEHPVQQPDGIFMLDLRLPKPGPYMAIAEFLPDGGTPQTFQQLFTTGEAFGRPANPALDVAAKTVDGMRVSLDASKVTAGDTKPLTFRIEDAASGAPVTDLEPYLGAGAHLLVVPIDLTEAIHGHPTADVHGPSVSFAPLVPRAGRYKAWIQFQRGGRVSTAAFVIDVP
jgi:heavy metal-binding protein